MQICIPRWSAVRTRMRALLRALVSIRIAIAVLIVLTVVAASGTAIPQRRPMEYYGEHYGETVAHIVRLTGLDDLYHAWWFSGLLVWLLVSMTACSVLRIATLIRGESDAPWDMDIDPSADLRGTVMRRPGEEGGCCVTAEADRICVWLRRHRYKPVTLPSPDNEFRLVAHKGRFGRYGSLMTHFGVIVVLLGGALSAVLGVTRRVQVAEGETIQVPDTPLAVHMEGFAVSYFPDQNSVKEYASTVSILTNGATAGSGTIRVNEPLSVSGFRFYQMNYRSDVRSVVVRAVRSADAVVAGEYRLPMAEPEWIPDLGLTVEALSFQPDFVLVNNTAGSRSERLNNPAVHLKYADSAEKEFRQWAFEDVAGPVHGAGKAGAPYRFVLADYEARYTSGLKVVKDHGKPIVYLGFVVVTLGTFLGCYVFHRQLKIRILSVADGFQITYAGRKTRNRIDFVRELRRLTTFLEADEPRQHVARDTEHFGTRMSGMERKT